MNAEQKEMLKRLKKPIDKYMGEIISGDWIVSPYTGEPFCVGANGQLGFDNCIRIPPFCTPDGKRCLWDMLQGASIKGKLSLTRKYGGLLSEFLTEKDPYTTVLKALCEQEGF